jgi:hypothetical protein
MRAYETYEKDLREEESVPIREEQRWARALRALPQAGSG